MCLCQIQSKYDNVRSSSDLPREALCVHWDSPMVEATEAPGVNLSVMVICDVIYISICEILEITFIFNMTPVKYERDMQ